MKKNVFVFIISLLASVLGVLLSVSAQANTFPESAHPYANNMNSYYEYDIIGASGLRIRFSENTELENGYDFLEIYQKNDALVGKYTGTSLAGKEIIVPGDYVFLRLTTDSSVTKYGFSIDYIRAVDKLQTPSLSKISNTMKGVKITWGAVPGASKYRVFRKTGSSGWSKVADTTSTAYTDKTASSGTKYTYTVRCLSTSSKSASDYDKTGKTLRYIAGPALPVLKNVSGGIKITWGAISGAAQYRIYRKTGSGSWTKIKDTTSCSYTDKNVTSGKTYTYTVRCLDSSGKCVSAYNTTGKTIKYGASHPERAAYKKIVQQYETQYGTYRIYYDHNDQIHWTGICFLKLIDLNGDGTEEFILGYQKEAYNWQKVEYHFEVYTYKNGAAYRFANNISWQGNNCPYFGCCAIVNYCGNYYVRLMPETSFRAYYYGFDGSNNPKAVYTILHTGGIRDGKWYFNGAEVSGTELSNRRSNLERNTTFYNFVAYAARYTIIDEIQKAKKTLGM